MVVSWSTRILLTERIKRHISKVLIVEIWSHWNGKFQRTGTFT